MPNALAGSARPRVSREGLVAIALLMILLAVLFGKSFQAGQTLFSSDGPLGAITAEQGLTLHGITGAWADLNWIGTRLASASPNLTTLLSLSLGPVAISKFYAPIALLILGFSAWFLFGQLGFSQPVRSLGALAVALNTDPFSYACWGLASITLALAAAFFALAAVAKAPPPRSAAFWQRILLGGLAVGLGIMEGFDVGAILSLYVAAFILLQQWVQGGPTPPRTRLIRAVACVGALAIFAAFASARTLSELIGTQIKGVAVVQEKQQSPTEQWDWATQWSLPKVETLRLIIPGLFGYRMDTPEGGRYWGSVGRQPGWEQHHQGTLRHSGSGFYAGVLVVLIGFWAVLNALQRNTGVCDRVQKRNIQFWAVASLVSLVLAYGRQAPFYQLFYALPFFSTIRNPVKFCHPLFISLTILFAYGLDGLYRQYIDKPAAKLGAASGQFKSWWKNASSLERRFTFGMLGAVAASVLGWLVYTSSRAELESYLATVGFNPAGEAAAIARFSIAEVGWFVVLLSVSVGLLILIVSGRLSGARGKWAILLLGIVLVVDLSRANFPWIVYYNYKEQFATNPVLDVLRDKPYEHRVAGRIVPFAGAYLAAGPTAVFPRLYQEWLPNQFQYYNVQSLDVIQMPRMPELDKAYYQTFAGNQQLTSIGRLWQLTNTRYVLGMQNYLDPVNEQFDPQHKSFRVLKTFDLPDGPLAIFEMGRALPRAKLYSSWQTITNDAQLLQKLADPAFDPAETVLLSDPVPPPPGSVTTNRTLGAATITRYVPKRVSLTAESETSTVLLLNDRFDPDWKVTVDGKPARLLRLNFIMRGVQLPPGRHTVEFRFVPLVTSLYVSLAGIAVCLGAAGFLAFGPGTPRRINTPASNLVPAAERT